MLPQKITYQNINKTTITDKPKFYTKHRIQKYSTISAKTLLN